MGEKPVLYCAWFCPFAQRAWIALLEKGVDFVYKEQDPYDKTPEFLAVNPRGLVPALVHQGHVIIESNIVAEYVDEAWPEKEKLLFPPLSSPIRRAEARIWIDFIGKRITPHFIDLHRSKDSDQIEKSISDLNQGLKEFFKAASPKGPFFFGPDFGIVDIALAPFVVRFQFLESFVDLEISKDFSRFHTWWNAVKERPSLKETMAPNEKFLARFQEKYFVGEKMR